MGKEFGERATSWAYRYNQRNPTNPSALGVAHASENWMMFKGTNTGYVLCVPPWLSSARMFIDTPVLMGQLLLHN